MIGGLHGNEPATPPAVRGLLQAEIDPDVEVWLVPVANPDGVAAGLRCNANGVDLNRNYPFEWQPRDGGPAPLTEPETQALAALVEQLRPDVVIWVHQPLGYVSAIGTTSSALEQAWGNARWDAGAPRCHAARRGRELVGIGGRRTVDAWSRSADGRRPRNWSPLSGPDSRQCWRRSDSAEWRGAHELRASRHRLHYSVITRAELFAGDTATNLAVELLGPFKELTIDRAVAERAGHVTREFGLRLPDALIAATALEHELGFVTRNTKDFRHRSRTAAARTRVGSGEFSD